MEDCTQWRQVDVDFFRASLSAAIGQFVAAHQTPAQGERQLTSTPLDAEDALYVAWLRAWCGTQDRAKTKFTNCYNVAEMFITFLRETSGMQWRWPELVLWYTFRVLDGDVRTNPFARYVEAIFVRAEVNDKAGKATLLKKAMVALYGRFEDSGGSPISEIVPIEYIKWNGERTLGPAAFDRLRDEIKNCGQGDGPPLQRQRQRQRQRSRARVPRADDTDTRAQ